MLGVLDKKEKGVMRNIYARYHMWYLLVWRVHLTAVYPVQRVSIIIQYVTTLPLLLSTSHNVYTCHSPKYHYIIVTVVYLVYCIIAVRVSWFCDHRACISDE